MIPYKNTKQWLFLLIFTIIGFIVSVLYGNWKFDKEWGKYNKVTIESSLNSVVEENIMERGTAHITLNDSSYYWFTWAVNFNYNPNVLDYFIKVGDSIAKSSRNDTIFIFRNGQKYEFKILHEIPKNKK